jgi:hypothetical protein
VELGLSVRVQDTYGGDLGFVHAPGPVAQGDVLAA